MVGLRGAEPVEAEVRMVKDKPEARSPAKEVDMPNQETVRPALVTHLDRLPNSPLAFWRRVLQFE